MPWLSSLSRLHCPRLAPLHSTPAYFLKQMGITNRLEPIVDFLLSAAIREIIRRALTIFICSGGGGGLDAEFPEACFLKYIAQISPTHTHAPRDVPRSGALILLQKPLH
jgi:hypothetical protein